MSSASASRAANRSADIENNDADHQLQRSLESTCRSPDPRIASYSSRSRNQEWNSSRISVESDYSSEVSGQFDDAEEPESLHPEHKGVSAGGKATSNNSPSSHSVKRQRSNDWPRQSVERETESTGRREQQQQQQQLASGAPRRWFGHYSRHASPGARSRSPRHMRPGRRSRFVEGHMNDTVSEKPPSIFFPDEARNETTTRGLTNRGSGIFRFGKTIASAFNPFGGWSVSEIWKGSQTQEGNQPEEGADDRLQQAQLAYEELKRAGYQGTQKGSYIQSLGTGAGASLPDQTWKSIQAKMEYGSASGSGVAHHSRQSSGQSESVRISMSGNSLRPTIPFPDLRKAKSSLAIPSIKKQDGMSSLLQHIDNRGQEVRHQKSRKDMQRQAKLLKRVSNLEDKLERAKRELRELAGKEDTLPRGSLNQERPYQRKFVPGALPSLPSERLLHESETTTLPETNTLQVPETEDQAQIRISKTPLKSPKSWRKPSERSSSAHSPSRKRKSPDPESRKKQDQSDSHGQPPPIPQIYSQQPQKGKETQIPGQPETEPDSALAESDINQTPLRKPKLPKNARSDSPGSVERKQKQKRSPAPENTTSASPAGDRVSPSVSTSRPLRSTSRNRSATPVLRMKRGRGDLRSTASPGHGHGRGRSPGPSFEDNKENQHYQHYEEGEDHTSDGSPRKVEQQQPQPHDVEVTQQDEPATPNSNSTPSRRKARYEYIPPVPPLPKDLAATAAKVDRRLAREMGKRREQMERDGTVTATIRKASGGFQWPEEFF
ncbi:putative nuclear RNA binding protein [Aspergillus mulundensis]|uniref:Nuclear RNA binding protein n=1 Tax=Aspergillus mulundensis TaxID=1810919 RepID=A0A3D8RRE3_9EURO|nr:Uncharacterized protein DSM5745_06644 [Aspergillus mulundensis]RDW76652.1 Uncharacterized protein DSM5745_06644 [Aspergillus mulundensis]